MTLINYMKIKMEKQEKQKRKTKKAIVTPWEVSGDIDYKKLLKEFGTEEINTDLIKEIKNVLGDVHPLIKRRLFYSHRDLPQWLNHYKSKKPVALYTGRGPSEGIHLGHVVPWILTKWIQEKTNAALFFQFTDDEKFWFKEDLSWEKVRHYTYENMLDVAAIGFDKRKTFFLVDTIHANDLYPLAVQVAKKITFSTAKSVFGFTNSNNIGEIFYTSMQAAPAMLPKYLTGKDYFVLIPMGIDQDPHFRVARDVLPKLGYRKPACLHSKFFPSLMGEGKMSASSPDSTIYLSDPPEEVERKIKKKALTGGRDTAEEQRRLGGRPDICPIFHYYMYLFEPNDKALEERRQNCLTGKLLCGECKAELIERINKFLEKHRENREKVKDEIIDWLLSEDHRPK